MNNTKYQLKEGDDLTIIKDKMAKVMDSIKKTTNARVYPEIAEREQILRDLMQAREDMVLAKINGGATQ